MTPYEQERIERIVRVLTAWAYGPRRKKYSDAQRRQDKATIEKLKAQINEATTTNQLQTQSENEIPERIRA